jgi:hypothetical protein
MPGIAGVGFNPPFTRRASIRARIPASWIIDRPTPAGVVDHRPHDPRRVVIREPPASRRVVIHDPPASRRESRPPLAA